MKNSVERMARLMSRVDLICSRFSGEVETSPSPPAATAIAGARTAIAAGRVNGASAAPPVLSSGCVCMRRAAPQLPGD